MQTSWKTWYPPLNDGQQTLGGLRTTLPGVDPNDVSLLVRLIENPESPFALPGAITLERHDAVHMLLGRGLLSQDEAFVIGFTMGCARQMNRFYEFLFTQIGGKLYPKPYRFSEKHLRIYQLAVEAGQASGIEELHHFPFENYDDWTLDDLRETIGLDMNWLKSVYAREVVLLPNTRASKRLNAQL